jgi:hypothetical protein
MFEKFTTADARDFQTRYLGTFGFFKNEDAAPLLVKLVNIDGVVYFQDRRGVEYNVKPDTNKNIGFEFLPPKSGFFNTDEGAVFVQRKAARQWQRGICDRNITMYLMMKEGWHAVQVNFKYLEKVYNGSVPFADAYKSFVEGKVPSVALNSQFSIDVKNRVYVFSTECGKVIEASARKLVVRLTDPVLFRTEIYDAVKNHLEMEFQ